MAESSAYSRSPLAALLSRRHPHKAADALQRTADTPSEASERLSEGVRDLREKAEGLLEELQSLGGRLEATEIQELALREELRRETGRSEALRAEPEAERAGRREKPQGPWRRLFGG